MLKDIILGFKLVKYGYKLKENIFMLVIFTRIKIKTPSAIDVYRGNTELRITSVNGIPTDTVVVFKNK